MQIYNFLRQRVPTWGTLKENSALQPFGPEAVKKVYANLEGVTHISYPSCWAAATFFAIQVADNLGSGGDNGCRLIAAYLRGIFLGILNPTVQPIPLYRGKMTLFSRVAQDQYPIPGHNPVQNGQIVVLKYRGEIVALEYPDTLFFPCAPFSHWPDAPTDEEKTMIDEIEREFIKLSIPEKNKFHEWMHSIFINNTLGAAWRNSFIKEGWDNALAPTATTAGFLQGSNITIMARNGMGLNAVPLMIFSVADVPAAAITVTPGSLKINISFADGSLTSITIDAACQGHDGQKYIFGDLFEDVFKGSLKIRLVKHGKFVRGATDWDRGLKYENGNLEINAPGKSESHPVRIINSKDMFVESLAKFNDRYPDSALRRVFFRDDNNRGIEEILSCKGQRTSYQIKIGSAVIEKKLTDFKCVNLPQRFGFSIWPPSYHQDWSAYFCYLHNPEKDRDRKIDDYWPAQIKLIGGDRPIFLEGEESVKKIAREFIDRNFSPFGEPAISIEDGRSGIEMGSYSLCSAGMGQLKLTRSEEHNNIGIDFGTSATVVASTSPAGTEVLDFLLEPFHLFNGETDSLRFLDTRRFDATKEIPSFLFVHDGRKATGAPVKGFEESSIVMFGEEVRETLLELRKEEIASSFKRNLKWGGDNHAIGNYLYMVILAAIWQLFKRGFANFRFVFSYPVSFSGNQFTNFSDIVTGLISGFRDNLKNCVFDEARYISETDALLYTDILGDRDQPLLVLDMGGGSTDIYFEAKKSEYRFIDSLKVAGELIVDMIARNLKTYGDTDSKLKQFMINGELRKRTTGWRYQEGDFREKTELVSGLNKIYGSIFAFVKRGILALASDLSLTLIQGLRPPSPERPLPDDFKINVVFLGNGWKLFDIFPSGFKYSLETMIRECIGNGLGVFGDNQDPKSWLAKTISENWKQAKTYTGDGGAKGVKSIIGLDVKYDAISERSTKQVVKKWNDAVPSEIIGKDNPSVQFISAALENDLTEILATKKGTVLMYLNKSYDEFIGSVSHGIEGFVRSPLAVVVEKELASNRVEV